MTRKGLALFLFYALLGIAAAKRPTHKVHKGLGKPTFRQRNLERNKGKGNGNGNGGFSTKSPTSPTSTPSEAPTVFPTAEPPVSITDRPTMSPSQSPTPPKKTPNTKAPGPPPPSTESPSASPTVASSAAPSPGATITVQDRTLPLLPFYVETDGELNAEEVDQVLEMYLYEQLADQFSTLEYVLLVVAFTTDTRLLRELTVDFTGEAVFLDTNQMPTEEELQEAQLGALSRYNAINVFIEEQDLDFTVDKVVLDGEELTGLGDDDPDRLNGDKQIPLGQEGDNNLAMALSLTGTAFMLGIVAYLLHLKGKSWRAKPTDPVGDGEFIKGFGLPPDTPATIEPSVAAASPPSVAGSTMSWDSVMQLSHKPVEQMYEEELVASRLGVASPSPQAAKAATNETVVLRTRDEQEEEASEGQSVSAGEEEDSLGFLLNIAKGAPPSPVADNSGSLPRSEYKGHLLDLTVDLADFEDS